jgi:hypothetical protein
VVAGVRPCATLRFRSNSEKAKLAAIEIEATADQTAAEILTAIKTVETVDGAGSELDSDLRHGGFPRCCPHHLHGADVENELRGSGRAGGRSRPFVSTTRRWTTYASRRAITSADRPRNLRSATAGRSSDSDRAGLTFGPCERISACWSARPRPSSRPRRSRAT